MVKGPKGIFETQFNKIYDTIKSAEHETILHEMFKEKEYLADKYTKNHFNPLSNESVCIHQSVQILRRHTVHCLATKLLLRSCRRNNTFEDTVSYIRSYNKMCKSHTRVHKLVAQTEADFERAI